MKNRIAAFLAVIVVLAAGSASAAEAYTRAAFQKAQATGAPILVHVTAPWCPTCRAQEPTVSMMEKQMPMLKVFKVDFDSQKDALAEFRVRSQSTLIMFKGPKETGRSVGVTDPSAIADLATRGLM